MHGLGVRPSAWPCDVGIDDPLLEFGGEVEDVMDQTQLLGHPAGVLHVGHRTAARIGRAAPQLQRGPHHPAGTEPLGEQGGGHRGIDTSGHGHQHTHGLSLAAAATAPGTTARARSMSASVVVVPSENRIPLAASSRPSPIERQHVAGLDGAARAGGAGRHRHPGLVEQDDQGLALDTGETEVEMAGDLVCSRRPVSAAPATEASRPSPSRSRQRRHPRHRLGPLRHRRPTAPRPWPRCRPRCGCRSAVHAPGPHRGSPERRECRAGRPARPYPSAHRTCGR